MSKLSTTNCNVKHSLIETDDQYYEREFNEHYDELLLLQDDSYYYMEENCKYCNGCAFHYAECIALYGIDDDIELIKV